MRKVSDIRLQLAKKCSLQVRDVYQGMTSVLPGSPLCGAAFSKKALGYRVCGKILETKLCVRAQPWSCRLSSLNSSPVFRPGRAPHAFKDFSAGCLAPAAVFRLLNARS